LPLNRQQVIDEALRLTDADGLDALSLRTLASRLGVQAPTLYWHIGSKTELLNALADAIMDGAIDSTPPPPTQGDGRRWLLSALVEFRAAMLRHRDGARIVSGARDSFRRADFSELGMATLVDHGIELQRARLLVLAGERYTLGFVLEEQAPEVDPVDIDPDELRRRLPVATRAIIEYFSSGRTADDLYRDGVQLILQLE
jgi:TetR/AcrR family transcriptional regulator, tetracycline repressor protein